MITQPLSSSTFGTRLRGSVADARPRVEAALKAEGFGVLTEIDVQATLRAKLGEDVSHGLEVIDPARVMGLVGDPGIGEVAAAVRERLERAVAAI